MHQNELKKLFKKNNALLQGHFRLSSGLHSDTYFQSALILQYPRKTTQLAEELVKKIKGDDIKVDVVLSPAMGGVIIGYEVGRLLNVRAMFTERVNGNVVLRRGFLLHKGEKVLIVEDVITTGISTKEVINSIKPMEVKIVAILSLVDRSAGKINFVGVPRFSLLSLEVKNYKECECPLCRAGIRIVKPGSRK